MLVTAVTLLGTDGLFNAAYVLIANGKYHPTLLGVLDTEIHFAKKHNTSKSI